MNSNINIPEDKVREFCIKHHIGKLSVFGSALREDFAADSDIDILVEFESGHVPGFAFFAIADELSELFGRKVDLNTKGFLSRYFRDKVVQEAEIQYARS